MSTPQEVSSPPEKPAAAAEAEPHYVSEELPAGFWDDEPLPPPQRSAPAEAYVRHDEPSGGRLFDADPGSPSSAPVGTADIEAHPLFSQLRALFPGRVVEKQVCLPEDESEATEDTPPDAIDLVEDHTEREFDDTN